MTETGTPTVLLPHARPPTGLRLYAIGDVHGEIAEAHRIRTLLDADRRDRPTQNWREIWLGDLIDRGPDSAGVVALLADDDDDRRQCVLGNHDEFLLRFLTAGGYETMSVWFANGGLAACQSWGVDARAMWLERHAAEPIRQALIDAIPQAHVAYLARLPRQIRFGDFGFAHAGVRPGRPWAAQMPDDLIWIRAPFLNHPGPHEVVVVHGHTPTPEVDVTPARIGIDTGAGKGGRMSAIVIEDDVVAEITASGRRPLTVHPPR
ncbi:MAG: metallophosphoesterase [Pseudomonadota bacterium]